MTARALQQMARLVYETRAAELRQALARRAGHEAQLRALEVQMPQNSGLPLAAEAQALLAYDAWASRRRAAINGELARARADCLHLTGETRRAFARAQAVDALAAKALALAVLPRDVGDQDVSHDVAEDEDGLFL